MKFDGYESFDDAYPLLRKQIDRISNECGNDHSSIAKVLRPLLLKIGVNKSENEEWNGGLLRMVEALCGWLEGTVSAYDLAWTHGVGDISAEVSPVERTLVSVIGDIMALSSEKASGAPGIGDDPLGWGVGCIAEENVMRWLPEFENLSGCGELEKI